MHSLNASESEKFYQIFHQKGNTTFVWIPFPEKPAKLLGRAQKQTESPLLKSSINYYLPLGELCTGSLLLILINVYSSSWIFFILFLHKGEICNGADADRLRLSSQETTRLAFPEQGSGSPKGQLKPLRLSWPVTGLAWRWAGKNTLTLRGQ